MECCKAIILKKNNYSDTQTIIHAYSLEKGYLSLISPSFFFKRKKQFKLTPYSAKPSFWPPKLEY